VFLDSLARRTDRRREMLREKVVGSSRSVCCFVFAGGAAGFAVEQAIGAEANVELGLAEGAEFFAPATCFRPFALSANGAAHHRL